MTFAGFGRSFFFTLLLSAAIQTGYSTTIDFNGIPDGTLVSAGNPYGGQVIFSATANIDLAVPPYSDPVPGTIQNGSLYVGHPLVYGAGYYYARIEAGFLQPVSTLSFDYLSGWELGYVFTTIDGSGVVSSIQVFPTDFSLRDIWRHAEVPIPAGTYLTSLTINVREAKQSNAEIWLDNVTFNVPDTGNSLALLGLSVGGLCGLRAGRSRLAALRAP